MCVSMYICMYMVCGCEWERGRKRLIRDSHYVIFPWVWVDCDCSDQWNVTLINAILLSRLRSAFPSCLVKHCLVHRTFALGEANCYAESLINLRLSCSEIPRYMKRTQNIRCQVERETAKTTSVTDMWVKKCHSGTEPIHWRYPDIKWLRDKPLSQALPEFLDSQSCEHHKLFSAARFWGTLLCNSYKFKNILKIIS